MTDEASNTQEGGLGPKPGESDEQYSQRMADKYRSQSQLDGDIEPPDGDKKPVADAKPQRPDNVPEKFWDAEKGEIRTDEVLKSHSELEKKLSQKPAAPKPNANGGTENGENAEGEQQNGEADPIKASLESFAALREQATQKLLAGESLPDDIYEAFETKHGLSRQDIDTFVAGQEAIGQLARMEVFGAVGGEEQYKAMVAWARENYDKKEVEVYDRDVNSMDPAVRLTAAKGLAARYAQANGSAGVSVTEGVVNRGTTGYASGAEMRSDMKDPRYEKDQAFRDTVARKAAAARAAGIDLMA